MWCPEQMRGRKVIRLFGLTLLATVACVTVAAVFYLRLPWITTETIRFDNDDVTLVGTLALPRWHDGPYPAAVIVHGSGAYPRWVHWLQAKQLVPHGMAVLIYDKRGVGDSSGTNPQSLIGAAPHSARPPDQRMHVSGKKLIIH